MMLFSLLRTETIIFVLILEFLITVMLNYIIFVAILALITLQDTLHKYARKSG